MERMDERWVDIQQRTFTGWVNQHLKDRILKCNDLVNDLKDGILLINLLEIISSKSIPNYNKKPKIRAQLLENCGWALKFLKDEGIKLVAIGPEDITDSRRKLILGLIWTIILRYHIQKGGASGSARNDLLAWVQKQIPECNVKDFSSSWNDGKAICHLVESLKSGTIDLGPVDSNPDPLGNATLGTDRALSDLDIPKILSPSDMVSPESDELSVMTYISYFRDYANNAGKRADREKKEKTADPARSFAFGAGLEKGEQFVPGHFLIQAKNCFGDNLKTGGDAFEVSIVPATKGAQPFAPTKLQDNGDGTYEVSYTPLDHGKHTVSVTLRSQPIHGSPYSLNIDRSSITATGPGLESANVFLPTDFTINAQKLHEAKALPQASEFGVTIQGPKSNLTPTVTSNNDGTYRVVYTALEAGRHTVNLTLKGRPIANSPVLVNAKSALTATGSGVDKTEQFLPTKFTIGIRGAQEAGVQITPQDAQVTIASPTNAPIDAPQVRDDGQGNIEVTWTPLDFGRHTVNVTLKGQPLANSPFNTLVEKSTISASGPGLEKGEVLLPAEFTIDAKVLKNNDVPVSDLDFGVTVLGPKGNVALDNRNNNDGTFTVHYAPADVGRHQIQLSYKGRSIANSPYVVPVDKTSVSASGPGLEKGEQYIPSTFKVNAKPLLDKGLPLSKDDVQVKIQGPKGAVEPTIKDNGDGTFDVTYTPVDPGRHVVDVGIKGQTLEGAPYNVPVDKTSISAAGPSAGEQFIPTKFIIPVQVLQDAGIQVTPKDFQVGIAGPKGPVENAIQDNGDGTFAVDFTPLDVGKHNITVSLRGQPIANSPVSLPVEKSSITATGPGLEKAEVLVPTHFTIGAQKLVENNVPLSQNDIEVKITGPKGPVDPKLEDKGNGVFDVTYTPNDVGRHQITLAVKNRPIANSPYTVQADKSTLSAGGAGAERAEQFIPAIITVNAAPLTQKGAPVSPDDIKVQIQAPKGPLDAQVRDKGDGTFDIVYTPLDVGRHVVNLSVKGQPLANSPLNVPVEKSTIGLTGPGLDRAEVLLPTEFTIESQKLKDAGVPLTPSDVEVTVNGPKGAVPTTLTPNPDGSFKVSYTPLDAGKVVAAVAVKGRPIGNSPYSVTIDKSGITASGPGLVKAEQYIPTHFTVDAKRLADAGVPLKQDDLSVTIQGPKGPVAPTVKDNNDGTFTVNYNPVDIGRHNIAITAKNQPISGSPFAVTVDRSSISATGSDHAEQFIPASVKIPVKALQDAGVNVTPDDLKVTINGPKGPVDATVTDAGDGTFNVNYTPNDVGKHVINANLKGQPVANSPFNVNVEKSSIYATGPGLEKGEVLVPTHFVVGAEKLLENKVPLSKNDLEVKINGPKGAVEPRIEDKGNGTFEVFYTPSEVGRHTINLAVKTRPVAASPYNVPVDKSTITAAGAGAEGGEQFIPAEITVQAKHLLDAGNPLKPDDLKVTVQGPKGPVETTTTDNGDGTFGVVYVPLDVGRHTINAAAKGQPLANSPLSVNIEKSSISANGPGLEKAEVLVPTQFTVTATKLKDAGVPLQESDLELNVTGPKGPLPRTVHDNGDGTFTVSYQPADTGRHQISLAVKGRPVGNSPYAVNADKTSVTATPPLSAEQFIPADFVIQTAPLTEKGVPLSPEDVKVQIQGPKGPVEATVTPNPDGSFTVGWTPVDPGKHTVAASIKGHPIANAPFTVPVEKSSVSVAGPGLDGGEVLIPQKFVVNATVLKDRGVPLAQDEVGITIQGPKGAVEPAVHDNGDGTFDVTYVPTEPGKHTVNVNVKSKPVGASPYNVPINKTSITASGPGLEKGEQYIPTDFTIKAQNLFNAGVPADPNDFAISIQGPAGAAVQPTIEDNRDGTYNVHYTPQEFGKHKVEVSLKNQPVVGSPFSVPIEKSATGIGKSTAFGPGLEPGNKIDVPTHFTIQARNKIGDPMKTGGDPFKVLIKGPFVSEVDAQITDKNDGTYYVEYTPNVPGDHHVEVSLNGAHIQDSPFLVLIERDLDGIDPSQFFAFGPGLEGGNNAIPSHFTVQSVNGRGEKMTVGGAPLEVEVFGPNGVEAPAKVTDNNDGTYSVEYQAQDPGQHKIDVVVKSSVKIYYDHIKDSPFSVPIKPGTDAAKSQVHGPGLKEAYDTLPANFHIQAKDRDGNNIPEGGDPFEVQVTGPSGPVPVELKDNGDGTYDITYHPTVHGPHDIDVKLRGKPVGGGPFKLDVKQGADHEHSVVETYSFVIRAKTKSGEHKKTGGDNFTVTITGPSGTLNDVTVKDLGDGSYVTYYSITERGEYTISVRVNGYDIKGSPWKQAHD